MNKPKPIVSTPTTDRVAKGAKFLDTVDPEWLQKIRVIYLNMADPVDCVIGQLFESFGQARDELKLDIATTIGMGFDVTYQPGRERDDPDTMDEYADLTLAWKHEIHTRRYNARCLKNEAVLNTVDPSWAE